MRSDNASSPDERTKGGTSLPKFNHLYPMLFFGAFIRFCGAQKCGGPLSSADGSIEGIKSLDDTGAVETAAQSTPTRAGGPWKVLPSTMMTTLQCSTMALPCLALLVDVHLHPAAT